MPNSGPTVKKTGQYQAVQQARQYARRRGTNRLEDFQLDAVRQRRRAHVDAHHWNERQCGRNARDDQKLGAPDVQVLTQKLAGPIEKSVDQHVDGKHPPTLLIRHQHIQPTFDDNGQAGRVQSYHEPEQRDHRHALGEEKTQNRHRLHSGESPVRALESDRRDDFVRVQAPCKKAQRFRGRDQTDHARGQTHR